MAEHLEDGGCGLSVPPVHQFRASRVAERPGNDLSQQVCHHSICRAESGLCECLLHVACLLCLRLHLYCLQPLAVVTWGCVYSLQWVNPMEVKEWLLARNVDYQPELEDSATLYDRGKGRGPGAQLCYSEGGGAVLLSHMAHGDVLCYFPPLLDLIKKAPVHNFASLCEDTVSPKATASSSSSGPTPRPDDLTNPPQSTPHTLTAPPPPCQTNASHQDSCTSHTSRMLHRHQTGLTVLIVLLGVVLLGFVLLLAFKVVAAYRRRRGHKNQRYKSVSRYFPFSYEKQAVEVVIPALGVPKSGLAERQVLLNDSDEDEL